MSPYRRYDVAGFITERDETFTSLVERVGPPPARRPTKVPERFAALARTISFQLLATKAAATIHARVVEACDFEVTPESILRAGHARLRAAGLSNAKVTAMIALERVFYLASASGEATDTIKSWPIQAT